MVKCLLVCILCHFSAKSTDFVPVCMGLHVSVSCVLNISFRVRKQGPAILSATYLCG